MPSTVKISTHPWNTEFTWPEHHGPFQVVTDAQARAYDQDGYFVLEDAVDAETIDALDQAIAPGNALVADFLQQLPDGRISVAGLDTQLVAPHLAASSEVLHRFCTSELFVGLCHDLIGPDARLYWEQAVYKQPHSAEPVLWHQDNGYAYVEPQAYLTCWVALTDATLENGCIQVVPGLHHHGTLIHRSTPIGEQCFEDPEHVVNVPVKAGSIVVFTSLTPHATGHNRTDDVRKAYIVQYAPDGAVALRGDPTSDHPPTRDPLNDPTRQPLLT